MGKYTKYVCFLYFWDSSHQNKHWKQQESPINNNSLVDRQKIVFSPHHIKLDLNLLMLRTMKVFRTHFKHISQTLTRWIIAGTSSEIVQLSCWNRLDFISETNLLVLIIIKDCFHKNMDLAF